MDIVKHCETILQSRRILNRIVVLCEGDIQKVAGRESPQEYRKMEQMPDANFYRACVPRWWKENPPQFFNCGGRTDVLDTYFRLLELHRQNSKDSYLTPSKLFAIVDLDIQSQKIESYSLADTEEIFDFLYQKTMVNQKNASLFPEKSKIWVTGLVHKESYFFEPDLQYLFAEYDPKPLYHGSSLMLTQVYENMVEEMDKDEDLKSQFSKICKRVQSSTGLNIQSLEDWKKIWQERKIQSQNEQSNRELVYALLMMIKAKKYWNNIQPDEHWTREHRIFRDQLALEIGSFYSREVDRAYHLPDIFKTLHNFV